MKMSENIGLWTDYEQLHFNDELDFVDINYTVKSHLDFDNNMEEALKNLLNKAKE